MIRFAASADVPALLAMGVQFAEAAGVPFDPDSVVHTLRQLMESPDGVIIVFDDGGIVGMAGALAYRNYFDHSRRVAQELFWWIAPDRRSGGIGAALLEGLEGWAREIGASHLTMISLDALQGERVGKFYESRGYRPLERNFTKAL